MKKIIIRPAIKKDVPQAVNLINSQYARKKNDNYFIWQYLRDLNNSVLLGAFAGDRMVGIMGMLRRHLTNGAVVAQMTDILVDQDFRGQGIFTKMGEMILPDVDLYCVLPNANGKAACEKAFGWTTIGKIDTLVFSQDNQKDLADESAQLTSKSPLYSFVYYDSVLSQRFDQNPSFQYSSIKSDGQIAVTKLFVDPVTGQKFGDIVLYQCRGTRDKRLRFFRGIIDMFCDQGIDSVTTWALPHTDEFHLLKGMGFKELAQERYFTIHVRDEKNKAMYDLTNWQLMQADAEIF